MSMNSILGIFAKSPFKPLQEHIEKIDECAYSLIPFFNAAIAEDWEKADKYRDQIKHLEAESDDLKRKIRLRIPAKGLFMPVKRADILSLVTQQDKIANKAKDISGQVIGRQLTIPPEISEDFITYLKRCLDAVLMAKEAVQDLDDLLETGFQGREIAIVEKMINKIDAIEHDTDQQQKQLRRRLLEIEDHLKPVDVMYLYRVIELIGGIADEAERVGSRLELMLASV